MPENLGANDGILGEVFRDPAADHQKPGGSGLNFNFGQLPEVFDGINGQVIARALHLMQHQAETGGAVRKRRAENRHVVFVSRLHQRIFLLGVFGQVFAHFCDEFPGRIRAGFQQVGDFLDGFIAALQIVFADERVIDAVDIQAAQQLVIDKRRTLIMPEAQRLKKIHIHNRRAGRHNGVHHIVFHQVHIHLHAARRAGGAGQRQNDRAVFLFEHPVVKFGG